MDTNTHTVHQQRVNAFLSFLFFWSALVFVVATRLSLAAAHMGFSHCEAWAPEYVGSIVVCRLLQLGLWHVGSQFPDQGSKLCPLHWEGRFLTTGPQGMLLCSEVFEYNMTNLWLNTELCRYSGDHQKYKLKKKKNTSVTSISGNQALQVFPGKQDNHNHHQGKSEFRDTTYKILFKKPDAGRDWGQEEKGTTEDEMAGWHH